LLGADDLFSIAASNLGGAAVKKLPFIGLVLGAIAAFFALRRRKGAQPTGDTGSAERGAPPEVPQQEA